MKKSSIASALALATGLGTGIAEAGPLAGEFCLFDATGGPISDFTWPTVCDEEVTGLIDTATWDVASTQLFFAAPWEAHDGVIYGEGTWQVDTIQGGIYEFTVGPGQVGGHILFDWGPDAATSCGKVNCDIDVVNIWDISCDGGDPEVCTYISTDWDGDGIPGGKMIDGPFAGSSANFNFDATFFGAAPAANNTAASTSEGVLTYWTPDVSDPDGDLLTCSIVSQPPAGQGIASVEPDCSTGTYDPQGFTGPTTAFTYKANDGAADSNVATVTVSIQPMTTPTGFYWPTGTEMLSDYAPWLAMGCNGSTDYLADKYHLGKDIAAAIGEEVYAIADGEVKYVSLNGWGLGNVALMVEHRLSNGITFWAVYGHVRSALNVGAVVTAGEQIATIGPWPYGSHLHFGIQIKQTTPTIPWGVLPCSAWPFTNGFVEPITWITSQTPGP